MPQEAAQREAAGDAARRLRALEARVEAFEATPAEWEAKLRAGGRGRMPTVRLQVWGWIDVFMVRCQNAGALCSPLHRAPAALLLATPLPLASAVSAKADARLAAAEAAAEARLADAAAELQSGLEEACHASHTALERKAGEASGQFAVLLWRVGQG